MPREALCITGYAVHCQHYWFRIVLTLTEFGLVPDCPCTKRDGGWDNGADRRELGHCTGKIEARGRASPVILITIYEPRTSTLCSVVKLPVALVSSTMRNYCARQSRPGWRDTSITPWINRVFRSGSMTIGIKGSGASDGSVLREGSARHVKIDD